MNYSCWYCEYVPIINGRINEKNKRNWKFSCATYSSKFWSNYIDGLAQDCSITLVHIMEIPQSSFIKPLIQHKPSSFSFYFDKVMPFPHYVYCKLGDSFWYKDHLSWYKNSHDKDMMVIRLSGGRLNIKITSYQYRDPHVEDKMVSRPSYL